MIAVKTLRLLAISLAVMGGGLFAGLVNGRAQTSVPEEQIALGAQLYAENCAVCHGASGEGRAGATLAKDWPSIRPELTVRTIIEQGVPGSVMPAWSQEYGGPFNSSEIDALLTYILSWQTGELPDLTPLPTATLRPALSPLPDVEGDPNRGAALFAENCAMCHGAHAEGRVGATLAKAWPGIRPDLSIKTTIAEGVPGSAMPAWSKENGGPLGEQDLNDLVAFILALPASQALQPTASIPGSITMPWLQGWGGVLLFFVLLAVILVIAWVIQHRSPAK
jgi:cytochrome c oxidase cbb3-type subunit 3